jgi:hypothetical protein
LEYACGLATSALFEKDLGEMPVQNGVIELSEYEVDAERLERFTVSTERLEWWRQRITQVWSLREAR